MKANRPTHASVQWLLLMAVASQASATTWKEKVLYSFQGGANDGAYPAGGVVFDKTGNLYGATTVWGPDNCFPIANECGLVFELSPPAKKGDPWIETILFQFKGKGANDASSPSGGVILDNAGNVYGVSAYGGTGDCVLLGTSAGCGTVYKLSPPAKKGDPWTETLLYSFKSGNDGYFPWGTLTFDAKGNLYGATQFGGSKGNTCNVFYGGNCGTVFELSPPKQKGGNWTEKVLHSFAGTPDGANPNGGALVGRGGTLYGMTRTGGNQGCAGKDTSVGCGTVFELRPPAGNGGVWRERLLHVFTGGNDGALPNSGLAPDGQTGFYGTTGLGGTNDRGVVFQLSNGRERYHEVVLYNFTGGADGLDPGPLVVDRSGRPYGTTSGGGSKFGGTVFRLEKLLRHGWKLVILYTFKGVTQEDGASPNAAVTFDRMGSSIFGTTQAGGTGQNCGQSGCGTVFKIWP